MSRYVFVSQAAYALYCLLDVPLRFSGFLIPVAHTADIRRFWHKHAKKMRFHARIWVIRLLGFL